MKFYTDGSMIGLQKGSPVIGWAAVCNFGLVTCGNRKGGTNTNSEMLAIKDCLLSLKNEKSYLIEKENIIEIVTDSRVSIQIIDSFLKNPDIFDINTNENYMIASHIIYYIKYFKEKGKKVVFTKVQGHNNNLGNHFADYVANTMSEKLTILWR